MSKPLTQIRNANRNTNPTTYVSRSARRLIRAPKIRLQDDHQHPPAVERRERQDVDEGEVRRQDPGDVERHDEPGAEEDVGDLGRDADRARRPAAPPSGCVTNLPTRSPRPPRITPNQRVVSLRRDPIAVGRSRL